jgi:hypothetical protein
MSATAPKTIDLYGYCNQHEAIAGGAIIPGMLVIRSSATQVVVHNVEGAPAQPSFAVEYDLTGRTIADAYATADQVLFKTFTPGSGVYAWLAAGEDVAAGAFLSSNGDGTLKEAEAEENIVAQALEAVDNDGTAAVAVRIRVETVSGYVSAAT